MKFEDAKILIGDDSILARKQLMDALIKFGGNNFIEAVNGQEVIDKFKLEKPDLVFLDIVMTVKDGIIAVQEIMGTDKNALIIMVSSIGTQSQLKMAITSGAKDFIQKPIDEKQLKSILSTHFEGR